MKLKMIFAASLMIAVLASVDARADCSVSVSSSFVPFGQMFTFTVDINDFGPRPPDPQYRIIFFGAKNGVADIPPAGWTYPGTYNVGIHVLTGFGNPPSGGFSGNYIRWVLVYDKNNHFFCASNAVNVTLQ
jgi:hypothetical protein